MRSFTLVVGFCLLAFPVLAQGVLGRPLGLTESDFQRIKSAIGDVLEHQEVGGSANWANPETGKSGVVTAKRFYQKDNLSCADVETVTKSVDRADARTAMLPLCRTAEGWKLAF
ncbi:MAG TPA: RT0821/Lpp0805 family surface protein [Magnetospirillum sp.]|jgi:surface antigen|nr:RT0821/Lpp0805 family surface protein [Magnetospirillum sp.]